VNAGPLGRLVGPCSEDIMDNAYENKVYRSFKTWDDARSIADNDAAKTECAHDPDWSSVTVTSDGGQLYVDVNCKLCGLSGCIGTHETLKSSVQW
jgi:hypothetical protein